MAARVTGASPRPSYIVVGASAGGFAALGRILQDFPEELPCALLVVVHLPPKSRDWMAERLDRIGRFRVETARAGAHIRQGRAYVAPSGSHLIVQGERLMLSDAAPENYARPSIDVLFRSAAEAFGRRTIGLILSGMLKDGNAGLRAVRDAGGITIVQNPASAEEDEMPRNSMRDLGVDYCLELAEIGPLLELLVRRAGPFKRGVLETGLVSSLRVLRDRARLFDKLVHQSRGNPRTEKFLKAEVTALDRTSTGSRRWSTERPPRCSAAGAAEGRARPLGPSR